MTGDNAKITLSFVHPFESNLKLQATVDTSATPGYLIIKLIESGFIAKLDSGAVYKLVDLESRKVLDDHVSLAAAGVASDSWLQVLHSITGA